MSTGSRLLRIAVADAAAFRSIFPATSYLRWEVAGSARRGSPVVGDVEHVVEAAVGEVRIEGSLFAGNETANLLWHHVDKAYAEHRFAKHTYGDNTTRWGEKYRGLNYRGFAHEIFLADKINWGLILAIRTGPAAFSKELVTRLRDRGTPSRGGYVRVSDRSDEIIPCPDEATAFQLAGMPFVKPEDRR